MVGLGSSMREGISAIWEEKRQSEPSPPLPAGRRGRAAISIVNNGDGK
jgi:hypothetical protein